MKCLVVPVVALALLVAGAACTDDDSADPPPPTTTAPTPSDEAQLEQLADGWDSASKRIYLGEAEVSLADEFLTGDYLSGFREQAEDFLTSGQSGKRSDASSHDVESIEIDSGGSEATITECVIDADVIIDSATGSTIDDDRVAKRYRSRATSTPSGWRLSERETLSEVEGATTCPEE